MAITTIEGYTPMSTGTIAKGSDGSVWLYQPTSPNGMVPFAPSSSPTFGTAITPATGAAIPAGWYLAPLGSAITYPNGAGGTVNANLSNGGIVVSDGTVKSGDGSRLIPIH